MQNLLEKQREIFINEFKNLLLKEEICEKSLQMTSLNCGFDTHYHNLIFQGGLREILSFFLKSYDKKMINDLSLVNLPDKITQRISLAAKLRVKLMDRCLLQKICNFYSNPLYIKDAIKSGFNTCNIIWQYAGDRSIDYNYYSKRMLLLSVYFPSIIHYLGDESKNFEETDQFIDYSLEKIVKFGKVKNQIKLPKIEDIPILRLFI